MQLQVRVRTGPRDPARLPLDGDEALGQAMWSTLAAAVGVGRPRPSLLVLWTDKIEQIDLHAIEAHPRPVQLMAALAGRPDAACAAVAGVMALRRGRAPPVPAAALFIEWPDNRWWSAFCPLVGEGPPGAPLVRRAVDGAPRPGGVGGWFARVRREGLHLQLQPAELPQPGLALVH